MLIAATLADEIGEIFLVGATGHNYGNAAKLNVMNYKQAMASVDKNKWDAAVKVKHDKMKKYNVFRVVNWKDLPPGTKLFDSTWAMKKKPDGTYRARNAIRGFLQQESSPVVSTVGIRFAVVLTLVGAFYQHLADMEGAFLNGEF